MLCNEFNVFKGQGGSAGSSGHGGSSGSGGRGGSSHSYTVTENG